MAQEYELAIPEGNLKYTKIQGEGFCGICITGFSGLAGRVEVPAGIEERMVVEIARKAFLSKKHIRVITLPDTVRVVGDWAFAYCDGLRELVLSGKEISFGRAVFMDCGALQKIYIPGDNGEIAGLLAAAVTQMDSYYLLDLREAGSREWYGKWDARMMAILHSPDNEGYSRQVLCGEEDYGSTDLGAYCSGRRRKKIRLILARLSQPKYLEEKTEKEITDYLRAHTKGEPEEESWRVILEEFGDQRSYYELFAEVGCFHRENAAAVIADIGDGLPEMKAFFLRFQAEHFMDGDFFGGLML